MAENEPKQTAEFKWPVSDKALLKELKAGYAKPVPRILFQCPLPAPHPDRDPREAKQQVLDAKAAEELYAQRVICRVTRLSSLVVNKRYQGIEIHPSGYPIRVPQNKWIALPLAAVEVLERAYVNEDQVGRKRKNVEPDTTVLGILYTKYKDWEYSVERWDPETGESWSVERGTKPAPADEEDEVAQA